MEAITADKLERVLWRVRKRHPNTARVTNKELEKCVILEVGYDPRTYKRIRNALVKIGWLKTEGAHHVRLTNDDLSGRY